MCRHNYNLQVLAKKALLSTPWAQVGELQEALDAIKWGTDYLLNCHVEPTKFIAMYGSSEVGIPPFT